MGEENHHGECCSLDNREWILGAIGKKEALMFVEELSKKFGREIKYEDVFVDYEEGHKLFPEKSSWQSRLVYPALRVDMESERKFCIFYNKAMKACSVYDIRPEMCRRYTCDYLRAAKRKPPLSSSNG